MKSAKEVLDQVITELKDNQTDESTLNMLGSIVLRNLESICALRDSLCVSDLVNARELYKLSQVVLDPIKPGECCECIPMYQLCEIIAIAIKYGEQGRK